MHKCDTCFYQPVCFKLQIFNMAKRIGDTTLQRQLNTANAEGELQLVITKCSDFKEREVEDGEETI